jgi:hypothetical protein
MATVNAKPTAKVTHHGSFSGVGWNIGKTMAAASPTTPISTTCQTTRRVARETAVRALGPAAVTEIAPAALVISAMVSGHRRR